MPQKSPLEVSQAQFKAMQDQSLSSTKDLEETVEALNNLKQSLETSSGEFVALVKKLHLDLKHTRGTVEELAPYRRYAVSQLRWAGLIQHTVTKMAESDRLLKAMVASNREAELDLKRRALEKQVREKRQADRNRSRLPVSDDDDFTVLLGEFE